MNHEIKNLLVSAKNLILTDGWIQGDYGDSESGFCILGAVSAAYDEAALDDDGAVAREACKRLQATLSDLGFVTSVAAWNDRDGRTEQQVLDLLDTAAQRV